MDSAVEELQRQWANPGDIVSLLLLVGGDIVQKAIAQLIGYRIRLPGKSISCLSVAPVAFSFGWAAYGFTNLLAAIGDMKLMPTNEYPLILVNCSNGFIRETRSWVLGRLFRDHEIRYDVDARARDEGGRAESVRIDIFNLEPVVGPSCDFVWWLGWVTLLAQVAIAIIPWVLYSDWGIMIVTLCGNLLVALTCAMPQWAQEKWAGSKLEREKITCLTRGNGHLHIMAFVGVQGSWDLECLATGTSVPRPETRCISLVLAILWTCLLISISGLKEHTWFLVGIGVIGMLQNIFAAGTPREPGASNFHVTEFSRAPTIIGRRKDYKDDADANINLEEDIENLTDISRWASEKPLAVTKNTDTRFHMPQWLASMSKEDGVPGWLEPLKLDHVNQAIANENIRKNIRKNIIFAVGVHGALMELEKWVPTAGLALVQIFFPAGIKYNDESIRDNVHKKFWQRAYYTKSIRKRAGEKRRAEERRTLALVEVQDPEMA